MNKTYIQQVGVVSALGGSLSKMATALFDSCESGIGSHFELFDGSKTPVGDVQLDLPSTPKNLKHFSCRNNQFLLYAYQQIASTLQKEILQHGADRGAIVVGTSTSGIAEAEKDSEDLQEYDYRRQEIGNMSQFLEAITGMDGISYTLSTACSSSARAILTGHNLIQSGFCDYALVGGSDTLCNLTLNGFHSLEALSLEPCIPFSKNRSGINIGEGAALFVLSRRPNLISIVGVGESSDGYHISSPDPEGKGPAEAIHEALSSANLKPSDIGYINLHGTGTQKNDSMESRVINSIFPTLVPSSSTKPFMGHTLGAAGALEAAVCYLALLPEFNPNRWAPPHIWDGDVDPRLPSIPLAAPQTRMTSAHCMSNSFAFGGNNASLIFSGVQL